MPAVWMRVRSELRDRIRATLVMALAVGVAAGAALTALAGARRTDTAVSRLLAYERPAEGSVNPQDPLTSDPALMAKIAQLPQVAASAEGAFVLVGGSTGLTTVAFVDNLGFSRPLWISGRAPRPDNLAEMSINPSAAQHAHLKVGSTLRVQGYRPQDALPALRGGGADIARSGPVVAVKVVGIGRFPRDLSVAPSAPGVLFASNDFGYFTPAYFRTYGVNAAHLGVSLTYRLKRGVADLPSFTRAVDQLAAGRFAVHEGSDDLSAARQARRATRFEALALLLFGILATVVAAAMIAQALVRQVHLDAADRSALSAMGMTRSQLVAISAIRAAAIAVVGAGLAVVVAILLSPRMPIGLARQAEVHRGFAVDVPVFLVGSFIIVVGLSGWAALAAWRGAAAINSASRRAAAGSERPFRIAEWASRSGLRPSATVGVRMALAPGRAPTSVPVRTSLVSAVIAIAAVAATLSFGTNLTRLAERPRLQGWNWDVSVGNPHSDDISGRAIPLLVANTTVAGFSAMAGAEGGIGAGVEGRPVDLFAIDTVKGSVLPPFTSGRAPRGPDEIAFGAKTLRQLHRRVGGRVAVGFFPYSSPARTVLITGEMVLTPSVVNDSVPLGQGGLVTPDFLSGLPPDQAPAVNVFLVRFDPNANRSAALQRLQRDFPGTVLPAVRPPDIENLRRVDHLPTTLALLFALLALLTIGHTLVNGIRHRRRDLAILRTMGFVGGQVSAAVAWQATTLVVVGLVLGLPLGVAAGRWAWALVDKQFGLPVNAVVPTLRLALLVPGAVLAANAVAAVPGAWAARIRPARILRAE